jgi:hypothetical protein
MGGTRLEPVTPRLSILSRCSLVFAGVKVIAANQGFPGLERSLVFAWCARSACTPCTRIFVFLARRAVVSEENRVIETFLRFGVRAR